MKDSDIIYFSLLKQKTVAEMQKSYPGISTSIADWKGQDIVDFQEDLLKKANANLSEKWFYTHMKSNYASLPRIDMLNILSKYCGYAGWSDFTFKNKPETTVLPVKNNANRYFITVPLLAVGIIAVLYLFFKLFDTQDYRFSFIDADTREPIVNPKTEIILFNEGESPVHYFADKEGSFHLKTDKSKVKMVVKSPYYKTDTVVRIITKLNTREIIMLHTNDYALMLHYFSTMNVDDWEKRRQKLDMMFDENAVIYQVLSGKQSQGVALFNKQEFIDKLTMPTNNLKNLEILDSQFENGKITLLRFQINPNLK
ncbi:MAG: hypothetical protein U0W24_11540 [Bacteroidales bacterium]